MSTDTQISTSGAPAVDPSAAAGYRAAGWWLAETYLDDFDAAAQRTPSRAAVVAHRAGGPVQTLSYGELAGQVDRFAGALLALVVRRGDVVASSYPTGGSLPL
jgi:cyclohexanecarboxylate-CoA ligase